MPLTDAKIKAAKATGKEYKLPDSEGLYLYVTAIGSKVWRARIRADGKDTTVTLGKYPAMRLAEARLARNEIARKIAAGEEIDSPRKRKRQGQTFRTVAEEWIAKHAEEWRERYIKTLRQRLEHDAYPAFGDMPIEEVTPEVVLKMLREIENRGSVVVAKKVLWHVQQITAYAYATLRIKADPVAGLTTNVLRRVKPGHFAAVTTREDAAFVIRAVRAYRGAPTVRLALEFLMLTFVRPGNVRAARWEDVDLRKKVWTIPADQMKMGKEHKVPLSRQALALLQEAEEWEDDTGLVFPPIRKRTDKIVMISDGTFGVALRAMGIPKDMMTAHGFRSMASSLLNEAGHSPDVIERQLAHAGKDQIRDIYNRTEYWKERVRLMQAWADMVDDLAMHS
ncbi:MAG: tyrosine-type recombinase/integrase [Mailhella sp.]|nr:tyrosine-type recombinase/integrase [Mailhella sp.]